LALEKSHLDASEQSGAQPLGEGFAAKRFAEIFRVAERICRDDCGRVAAIVRKQLLPASRRGIFCSGQFRLDR
jgi:hypothetical protein